MLQSAITKEQEKKNLTLHTVYITEVFSHLHHQLRSQPQVLLHLTGPQVQVAVLHPQRLRFLSNTEERKTHLTKIINKINHITWSICKRVHVTLASYFDKVFNLKRQLVADIENIHILSKDFDFSCRHPLFVGT